MNASERLQAIIKQRREWESFGWGPLLLAWAIVLVLKSTIELWTGPRSEVGFAAYLTALVAQSVLAFVPGARSGTRQLEMHGFWALIAVSAWFFGSWAPSVGLLTGQASGVLELMFLAAGLFMTGLLKARKPLWFAGSALAVSAVLLALLPLLWAWRPLLLAATFGGASVVTLLADRRTNT